APPLTRRVICPDRHGTALPNRWRSRPTAARRLGRVTHAARWDLALFPSADRVHRLEARDDFQASTAIRGGWHLKRRGRQSVCTLVGACPAVDTERDQAGVRPGRR